MANNAIASAMELHFTIATKPAHDSLWAEISIVPRTYSSDAIVISPQSDLELMARKMGGNWAGVKGAGVFTD